jgi:CHAT domain-containing protein
LIDDRGAYLLDRYTVLTTPSVAVFTGATKDQGHRPIPRTVLVAANDATLGFVDDEATQVAGAYPKSIRLPDKAQEEAFAKWAPEADAIHFAGHGIGDDSGIEPASIILQDKQGAPKRMGVHQIASLRLRRAPVVVLAGCNTARGERRGSEGVISVAHGFLAAGSSSVVATLWPIDDKAAAEFVPRVHERLAHGIPAAEALRDVQLEWIHRRHAPTSLWAALQVIGR